MPTDTIFINALTFSAIIGVLPHERITPQALTIDLQLETECFSSAAATDQLNATVDYAEVAKAVETFCVTTKAQLVETLAEGIAQLLLQYDLITGAHITVSKPDALDKAASVGVKIYRCR